ncbi:MAG TPA: hypothetical protein VGI14_07735 [Casimicrobiaceae bacterium]|jgi:hypothetical protein
MAARQEVFGESLHSLLYRYWFWEWLFVDVRNAAGVYQRSAAWQHNLAQRRYLPIYMRRWLVVTAANLGVAAVLEKALAWMLSAAFFYTNGCIAVCVLLVTFAGWLLLGCYDNPRG